MRSEILILTRLRGFVRSHRASSRDSEPIYSSSLGLLIMCKMQIKKKNIWNLWRRHWFGIFT